MNQPQRVPRPQPLEKPKTIELSPEEYEDVEPEEEALDVDLTSLESQERPVQIGFSSEASFDHENRNEDSFYVSPLKKTMLVADGMGSVPGGERAARIASETLHLAADGKCDDPKLTELISSAAEELGWEPDMASLDEIKQVMGAEHEPLSQEAVEKAMRSMLKVTDRAITNWKNNDPDIQKLVEQSTREKGGRDEAEIQKNIISNLGSLGTTATLLKVWYDKDGSRKVTFGSIGDSRIYRLRGGKLERMTKDDSFTQALMDAGIIENDQDATKMVRLEDIRNALDGHPEWQTQPDMKRNYQYLKILSSLKLDELPVGKIRNQMLQNLGGAERIKKEYGLDLEPNISTADAEEGDKFMAMSDGVLDNLTDQEMQDVISRANDPEAAAKMLTSKANIKAIAGKQINPSAKMDDNTAVEMDI